MGNEAYKTRGEIINSSTISWWDALLEYMRAEAYLIK